MIKILVNQKDKKIYKESIKNLFIKEYKKPLNEENWNFLNGYSNKSVMIVYLDGNNVVGIANLIHNYHLLNKSSFEYFIFTTSIVAKEFRSRGVYTLIMLEMRKYLENSNCEFVMAYPNDLALPIITNPFYQFKVACNFSLRIVNNLEFVFCCDLNNCIKITSPFLNWRFSKNKYFIICKYEKIFICKEYNNDIDIVEIFNNSSIDLSECNLPIITPSKNAKFIVPSFRLENPQIGDFLYAQSIVTCRRNLSSLNVKNISYSNLCWDVL